jgi:predicted small metal-binding protein
MERFACKSLGLDCDFVVTGATKDEVMKRAIEHGSVVHADLMRDMTPEQSAKFAEQLRAAITAS